MAMTISDVVNMDTCSNNSSDADLEESFKHVGKSLVENLVDSDMEENRPQYNASTATVRRPGPGSYPSGYVSGVVAWWCGGVGSGRSF